VVDSAVPVSLPDRVVSAPIVREHHRPRQDELVEFSTNGVGVPVRPDYGCPNPSAALDGSEHNGAFLGRRATVGEPLSAQLAPFGLAQLPADERLVGLDLTRELCFVGFGHELVPDPVEHAPCGLVRHAKLALQVLGRDPASSAGDEVHGVEPQVERRGRPLEDRSLQRVDAEAARRAEPTRTLLRRVVALEHPLRFAALAERVLPVRGETLTPDVPQARLIVGPLAHELHERTRRFRGSCADRVTAVNRGHLALLVGKSASRGATCGALAFSLINGQFYVTSRTA